MSISKEQIKEKEKIEKKHFQTQVSDIADVQTKALANVNKVRRSLKLDNDIPNIGITMFNKLNEITREFSKAGISLYVEYNEKTGLIESNFVGDAIKYDIVNRTLDGVRCLERYSNTLKEIVDHKSQQVKSELVEITPLKRTILKMRAYFNPLKIKEKTDYTNLDFSEANFYMEEYKRIDHELWEYNLKDNLEDAIVKMIEKERCSTFILKPKVSEIIEQKVKNNLEKLELSELIPKIEKDLSQEILAERIDDEYNRLMDKLTTMSYFGKQNQKEKKEKKETIEKDDDEGR